MEKRMVGILIMSLIWNMNMWTGGMNAIVTDGAMWADTVEGRDSNLSGTEEILEESWSMADDSYMIPRTQDALNDFLEEHQTIDAAVGLTREAFGEKGQEMELMEDHWENTFSATPEQPLETSENSNISTAETDSSARLNIEGSQFSAAISRTSYPYYRKMICVPTVHVYYGQVELVEGRDYTVNYSEIALDSGVGTYYIYIDGCNAYTGTIRKTYQITAQSLASAALQTTTMCYDLDEEAEKKPAAVVKAVANPVDGDLLGLLEGRDYTVTYKNNRIPGTATAIVKGVGNYSGSKKLSFTITKVPLSELTVSLSDTSYTCTGKEMKPTVTVTGETEAGKKVVLKEGKTGDYLVSYKDNILPGTAVVNVRAVSSSKYYSGSVTQTFQIRMSKTSLTSLTSGSGSFTAKWIEKTGGRADGYHLQFSMDSGFGAAVRRSIRSSSTISWTEKGLKKGKTYYVRVRSYKKLGTKNYFSSWSQALQIKIK